MIIKNNVRIIAVAALFSAISFIWILHPAINISIAGYLTIFLTSVAAILSFKGNINNTFLDMKLFIYILILSSIIFITAIKFSENNRIILAISMCMFAPFSSFFISKHESKEVFFKGMAYGSAIALGGLFILSVIYAPMFAGRYYSIVLNPNELSTILIPMSMSFIYAFQRYREDMQFKKSVFFLLLLGVSFSLIFLSISRTGLLIFAFIICNFIFYLFVNGYGLKKIFKTLLLLTVTFFIMVQASIFSLNTISKGILKYRIGDNHSVYMFYKNQHGYVETDIIKELVKEKEDIYVKVGDRLSQGSESGEDVSSGRFAIWNATIKNLNLTGHSKNDEFYIPEINRSTTDAHNVFLYIGYLYGIPAMIVWTLFVAHIAIYVLYKYFRGIKNKKINLEDMLQGSIIGSFLILSMLSTTYTPMGSVIGLLFWISIPWIKEAVKK